ncbi:glycolate oxidase subunit GlcE [Rubrivivax gelatinosus]|nr:glycolate oxidase subunit GlcE [Rubrivivax gelatinosus]
MGAVIEDAALARLIERVQAARADGTKLEIVGGGSKRWHGEAPCGEPLATSELAGISSYEPSELVITARAGTPLAEVEAALAERGQWLAFEPPRFAPGGTVGGMFASGLSGPGRASTGSVRDFVLGATMLNGRGELLTFGGQVMKNVAGYDLPRLLAGSLGVLGLVCEVSLKVLPRPPAVATLRFELPEDQALRRLNEWAGQPLPLSASAWWDGMLVLRLAGAAAAVQSAYEKLGGEPIEPTLAEGFWTGLRDQRDEFFIGAAAAVERGATLWRLSLPSTAPPLKLAGEQLVEWGGAQRWLCTPLPAAAVRAAAAAAGGHATRWRGRGDEPVFTPLAPVLASLHQRLKDAFDPDRIFNPGRLYPDL